MAIVIFRPMSFGVRRSGISIVPDDETCCSQSYDKYNALQSVHDSGRCVTFCLEGSVRAMLACKRCCCMVVHWPTNGVLVLRQSAVPV